MTHPSVDHYSIQAPQVLRTHLELSAGARDGEPPRILVKVNSLGKPRPGLPPPAQGVTWSWFRGLLLIPFLYKYARLRLPGDSQG